MKKNKNLSLNKIKIAVLTNPYKIWGGTGDVDPGDGTDNPNKGDDKLQPKKLKCVNTSKDIIME